MTPAGTRTLCARPDTLASGVSRHFSPGVQRRTLSLGKVSKSFGEARRLRGGASARRRRDRAEPPPGGGPGSRFGIDSAPPAARGRREPEGRRGHGPFHPLPELARLCTANSQSRSAPGSPEVSTPSAWKSADAKRALMGDVHTGTRRLRLQVQWALGRVSDDPAWSTRCSTTWARPDPALPRQGRLRSRLRPDPPHPDPEGAPLRGADRRARRPSSRSGRSRSRLSDPHRADQGLPPGGDEAPRSAGSGPGDGGSSSTGRISERAGGRSAGRSPRSSLRSAVRSAACVRGLARGSVLASYSFDDDVETGPRHLPRLQVRGLRSGRGHVRLPDAYRGAATPRWRSATSRATATSRSCRATSRCSARAASTPTSRS